MNLQDIKACEGRPCLARVADDRVQWVSIVRPYLAPMGVPSAVCNPVRDDGIVARDVFLIVRADRLDALPPIDLADPFGGEMPL